jgi:hypothetical protein
LERRWTQPRRPFDFSKVTSDNLRALLGPQPSNLVIPLSTGYKERLDVKSRGAKWNPDSKIWTAEAYLVHKDPSFWLSHVNFARLLQTTEEELVIRDRDPSLNRLVTALKDLGKIG